jgi:hypothetical protein
MIIISRQSHLKLVLNAVAITGKAERFGQAKADARLRLVMNNAIEKFAEPIGVKNECKSSAQQAPIFLNQ